MTRRVDLEGLAGHLAVTQGQSRRLVAIAGAPGSGKSTFAKALRTAVGDRVPSEVLPMDGFHFDDIVLNERGHRPRKGAPYTFDTDGLAAVLKRLASDSGLEVAVAGSDRSIEIARAGARIIGPAARNRSRRGPPRPMGGDNLGPDATRAKLEDNDLPNARWMARSFVPADFIVRNG